jgi:hypothetical protein
MSAVKILACTPRRSGALRFFVTVEMPSGLVFHECEQNGKWWAAPASKPMIGRDGSAMKDQNGKIKYAPVISFAEKARRDLWSGAVIGALHGAHPELLG